MENNIKLVDMLENERYTFTCESLELNRFRIICSTDKPNIIPNNPYPNNNAINIKTDVHLSWSGGVSSSDDITTYDVYFGKTNPPPIKDIDLIDNSYNPGPLDKNEEYYWRIISKDSSGATATGPIWSFITEEKDTDDNISNNLTLKVPIKKVLSRNVIFNKIN
jgi:hypothetical protein